MDRRSGHLLVVQPASSAVCSVARSPALCGCGRRAEQRIDQPEEEVPSVDLSAAQTACV
jgi:hypothetical protein